jgi:CSLREA domain-containing protein
MHQKSLLRYVCLLLSLFIGAPAYPAVFNIANGDVPGLKAAITTANSNGQADTINLASGGIYTLNSVDNSADGPTGLPTIANDVAGLDLTINGNGATIQRSMVAGTPDFRIFSVSDGTSLSCVGLTIANGKLSGTNGVPGNGAGIYAFQANVALTNCTLRNNVAHFGGAIYKNLGAVTADASFLIANSAASGAGIYSSGGSLVVTNSDFTENVTPAGGLGGAIRNEAGQLTISDSRLNLNTGGNGGALANFGNATLLRSVLNDNTTTPSGGGGAIYNGNLLTVESSTLHGNRTGTGGAIYNIASTTLRDSTISNNNATGSGGGLTNAIGTMFLTGCTVSRNTATDGGGLRTIAGSVEIRCATFNLNSATNGGGIYNGSAGGAQSGQVTLRNTILQRGANGSNLYNANGNIVSQGYNLSSDSAGGDTSTNPGGYLNERTDIRNTNANLGPLQNNGGPTLTHMPIASSAVIDAGDDAVLNAPLALTSDQRGAGFPRLRGMHVDIGAVESGVALVVTTVDDHDDGSCTAADCTLREAIATANNAGSGNISFVPGVTGTIQLNSALPSVGVNCVIQGPGATLLNVRRNSGGDYRILTISNGTSNGPAVSLVGMKFSNGKAPSGTFPASSGGGILNDRGRLQLFNCAVAGNSSFQGDQTYGGGILNYEGRLFVTTSTVVGNAGYFGGGIANFCTNAGRISEVSLASSTVSGNTSAGGRGGGIFNEADNADTTALLTMTNCTLSGNDVSSSFTGSLGGALFTSGTLSGTSLADIVDCTFSGNNADAAGAIYNLNFSAAATVTLRSTLLKTGTRGENFINSNGTIISYGHNLCNDAAGTLDGGTGPGGYLNGNGDIRNTNPLLGPLQDNGGLTFTHALLTGSAAINAGENTPDSETDQRGYSRLDANDIGAFEFAGAVPSIPISSAVSRKVHGTAGTFDIDLPQTGPLGVECRSGGPGGNHQVIVAFANPVSVDGVAVESVNGLANATKSVSANIVTINLTGVANAQVLTITLTGVNNGETIGNTVLRMGVLFGDTTGNAAVSSADVSQTKLASGQPVTATRFRNDLNLSGSINASDISAAKLSSGTALSSVVEP